MQHYVDPDIFFRDMGYGRTGQWLGMWSVGVDVVQTLRWTPNADDIFRILANCINRLVSHDVMQIIRQRWGVNLLTGYLRTHGDASKIPWEMEMTTDGWKENKKIEHWEMMEDWVLGLLMPLAIVWHRDHTYGHWCSVCKQGPYITDACPLVGKTLKKRKSKPNESTFSPWLVSFFDPVFLEMGCTHVCRRCLFHAQRWLHDRNGYGAVSFATYLSRYYADAYPTMQAMVYTRNTFRTKAETVHLHLRPYDHVTDELFTVLQVADAHGRANPSGHADGV